LIVDDGKPCRFDSGKPDYTLISGAFVMEALEDFQGSEGLKSRIYQVYSFLERCEEWGPFHHTIGRSQFRSAIDGACAGMTYGMKKYSFCNYLLKSDGFTVRRMLASWLRHAFFCLENPTAVDAESGLLHADLMYSNENMFLDLWGRGLLKDDRRPSIEEVREFQMKASNEGETK
jgi:hypothetical protein